MKLVKSTEMIKIIKDGVTTALVCEGGLYKLIVDNKVMFAGTDYDEVRKEMLAVAKVNF